MSDKYASFSELAKNEQEGEDYRVYAVDRSSRVAIFAPHGGYIEPCTAEIAKAIAGEDLSTYCFEGLGPDRAHRHLHITSTNFDEPRAQNLAGSSQTVVVVHGRKDGGDRGTVWLGGLDLSLRDGIAEELRRAGFDAASTGHDLPGRSRKNICNSGRSAAGVQLEIPRTLRDRLKNDEDLLRSFCDAVRLAIDRRR